jgi:hypothetical protein
MKQKLCLFVIHQTATSLQRTYNLDPGTIRYPTLDESNWMKSTYFTIRMGKILLPKLVASRNPIFFLKNIGFTSSTFPIQLDFSQNQPTAITLNTSSPRTLFPTLISRQPQASAWLERLRGSDLVLKTQFIY